MLFNSGVDMNSQDKFQPTLELLSVQVAQAQHAYVMAVIDLFDTADKICKEQLARDLTRLMDSHVNRGLNLESLTDMITCTQLVKTQGWKLFASIDEAKVTDSIMALRNEFQLNLGAAATLFYTRSTVEPVRYMLGMP